MDFTTLLINLPLTHFNLTDGESPLIFSENLIQSSALINDSLNSVYQFSTPNVKVYYPEPFIATSTFHHNDMWFVHIGIYQYWLWFFFIFLIIYFVLMFVVTLRWSNLRLRPRRETRGVSRSKCGDLITATVPVTWATSIIVHESTDSVEFYDGFGTTDMAIGIRAFQWGWEYYYPKNLTKSPLYTSAQLGSTLFTLNNENSPQPNSHFIKNLQTTKTGPGSFTNLYTNSINELQPTLWGNTLQNELTLNSRTNLLSAFQRIFSSQQSLNFFKNYKLVGMGNSLRDNAFNCEPALDYLSNRATLQLLALPQASLTPQDLKSLVFTDLTPTQFNINTSLSLSIAKLNLKSPYLKLQPYSTPNLQQLNATVATHSKLLRMPWVEQLTLRTFCGNSLKELNLSSLYSNWYTKDSVLTLPTPHHYQPTLTKEIFNSWVSTATSGYAAITTTNQQPTTKITAPERFPSNYSQLQPIKLSSKLDGIDLLGGYTLTELNLSNTKLNESCQTIRKLSSYFPTDSFIPLNSNINTLPTRFFDLAGVISTDNGVFEEMKQSSPTDSDEHFSTTLSVNSNLNPHNKYWANPTLLNKVLSSSSNVFVGYEPFADLEFPRSIALVKFENLFWEAYCPDTQLESSQSTNNPYINAESYRSDAQNTNSYNQNHVKPLPSHTSRTSTECTYEYPTTFFEKLQNHPTYANATLIGNCITQHNNLPSSAIATFMNSVFVQQNLTDTFLSSLLVKFYSLNSKLNLIHKSPVLGLSSPQDILPTASQFFFSPWLSFEDKKSQLRVNYSTSWKFNSDLNLLKSAQIFKINDSSIWKIFRSAFYDKKSAFNLGFYNHSALKLPTLMKNAPTWNSSVSKTSSLFLENLLFKPLKSPNQSTGIGNWATNLSLYFTFEFPFKTAFESDVIRYSWFDWYSRRALRTVKASDLSKYNLCGAAISTKFFDYQADDFEAVISSSTYLANLAKSRQFYLPLFMHSYFNSVNALSTNLQTCIINYSNKATTSLPIQLGLTLVSFFQTKNLQTSPHLTSNRFTSFDSALAFNGRAWSYSINTNSPHSSYTFILKLSDILSKRDWLLSTIYNQNNIAAQLSPQFANGPQNNLIRLAATVDNVSSKTTKAFVAVDESMDYPSPNKNQYKLMRRGITSMLKLHAESAVAMPTETRLQLLSLSKDIIHSWAVPSAGIKIDCVPGYSSHRVIVFFLSGVYWGQCMEICGRFHHWMPIVVYFMKRDLFFIWCTHFVVDTQPTLAATDYSSIQDSTSLVSYNASTWL